jgi:hypothetical protein
MDLWIVLQTVPSVLKGEGQTAADPDDLGTDEAAAANPPGNG